MSRSFYRWISSTPRARVVFPSLLLRLVCKYFKYTAVVGRGDNRSTNEHHIFCVKCWRSLDTFRKCLPGVGIVPLDSNGWHAVVRVSCILRSKRSSQSIQMPPTCFTELLCWFCQQSTVDGGQNYAVRYYCCVETVRVYTRSMTSFDSVKITGSWSWSHSCHAVDAAFFDERDMPSSTMRLYRCRFNHIIVKSCRFIRNLL